MAVVTEREELLRLLRQHKPAVRERFGVARLSVFGSMARGSAAAASDLDVLGQFDGPATSARFFGLQFWLEDLTGRTVDLVTEKALRPELRSMSSETASMSDSDAGTPRALLPATAILPPWDHI